MTEAKETPLYALALQQLQLREWLHQCGIPASMTMGEERTARLKLAVAVEWRDFAQSCDYTMAVLRTVGRDLRNTYYNSETADAICAQACRDYCAAGGMALYQGMLPPRFSDVFLAELFNEQSRQFVPTALALEMANRRAWHAQKTLDLGLYDDDFGPVPFRKRDTFILPAPAVVARERDAFLAGVERACSKLY